MNTKFNEKKAEKKVEKMAEKMPEKKVECNLVSPDRPVSSNLFKKRKRRGDPSLVIHISTKEILIPPFFLPKIKSMCCQTRHTQTRIIQSCILSEKL